MERLTKRKTLIYKNNETNEVVKEENYVIFAKNPYDTNTMLPNFQEVLKRLADYEDSENLSCVKEYDKDCTKPNQTNFINNSDIYDCVKERQLTVKEIIELKLFVNPLDGTVFRIIDNELIRDDRYEYSSY